MKTKLITLLLLVALCVSTLAGCAYNYQKEDLSVYATVDADALYNALQKLSIKDADFTDGKGENAQIRKDKTLLSFVKNIADAIKGDTDRQMTEGKVGAGDYITYCYYKVANNQEADKDGNVTGEKYILSAEYMQKSKAVALLLMGNAKDTLNAQIESAVMDFDVANLYKETTANGLPDTGWALVSASYNVGTDGAKKTASYMLINLAGGNEGDVLTDNLAAAILAHRDNTETVEVKVGTKFATGATEKDDTDAIENDPKITVKNAKGEDVTFYDITVKSVITGKCVFNMTDGSNQPIGETPYADTEKYTAEELLKVSLKDMYGNSVPVKNNTLIEYYVFPVTAYDIETVDETNKEGAVRELLFSIYESSLKITALDVFRSGGLAYTKEDGTKVTLTEVISNLILARSALTEAESALTAAEKTLTDAEKKLKDETDESKKGDLQTAVDTAKADVETKKKAVEDKKAAVQAEKFMPEIVACKKDDGTTAIDVIYQEYYDSLYEILENEYENEILTHVNEALGKLLYESVKFTGETPKKAVDEAYDRNMEAYKYEYYTGSNGTDSNAKKYTALYKDLNTFLCEKVAKDLNGKVAETVKDAQAAIRKEAEEQVKETIAVYVLAAALNSKYDDAELVLEKSSAKDYATLQAYVYNQQVDSYYEYLSSLIGTTYTAPASEYRTADYYIQYYGENALRTAYLADLMWTFLVENEEEDEDAEDTSILDFTHIVYEIADDTADETPED